MVALTRKESPEVAANGKKREASDLVSEGNDVPTPAKKAKHSQSLQSIKASRLKSINELPTAKTELLDVFVWGTGSMCELGLGPEAKTKEVKRPRLNPFLKKEDVGIVDIVAGGMHSLALDHKNQLWSWGGNDSGVLGRDTSGAGNEQLRSADADDDDEDGDLNPVESTPGLVEGLPKDKKIIQLAATDNLSAVLLETGEVYAWGTFRCNEGILGFNKDVNIQKTPTKIPDFENIVQLASGKDHLLGLDIKGIVYAWGNGQQYQLGRKILERTRMSSLEPRAFGLKKCKFVGSGEFHSFAITTDGKVLAWGLNQYGQCGTDAHIEDGAVVEKPTEIKQLTGKDIVYITGGEHHTLALASNGDVYTFGRYDMKEIGIEENKLPKDDCVSDKHGNVRSLPVPTKLTTLPPCKAVAAGSHHSVAVTKDGIAFSWGFADTYALGLGNLDEDVAKPTRINNTATKEHDIKLVALGGQFSLSAGTKMDEDAAEDRLDAIEAFEEGQN
ncbi:hypothetical protein CANARDRAFT_239627 [[Candida] arabinofermentans NRRL YB-2248]|uniref:RCC1-like domain-containing protein n=1 Tax=[Candida] arabinofermentans NRRL YB-2248 TaxID=983967 RepID=A0A1E4STD0_9ASCO|nr:hypothetical protein CANARDRAFT_239627 [[Candida] arabinofermentans NRRL YB-2248]